MKNKSLCLYKPIILGNKFLIAAMLLLCFFSVKALARNVNDIIKSKELRVCISPTDSVSPPTCRNNCAFSGRDNMSTALSQGFAESLASNVKPVFISIGWDEQFTGNDGLVNYDGEYTPKLLATGECDMFPNNLAKNVWRDKKLEIIDVFLSKKIILILNVDKKKYPNLQSLAGKTVAITKDTSFHTWVEQVNKTTFAANPIKIKLFSLDETISAVVNNFADFSIDDSDGAFYASKRMGKKIIAAFSVGEPEQVGWAFSKSDTQLAAKAREYITTQTTVAKSTFTKEWLRIYGLSYSSYLNSIKN